MSLLRTASSALKTALAAGPVAYSADLFTVTLASGTVYYWTTWTSNLVVGGNTFVAVASPFLSRSRWNVVNTMTIPTLELRIIADNSAFAGGAQLKLQVHNGLFDGCSLLFQRVFMPTPGDVTTLGTVDLFKGDGGKAQIIGTGIVLHVKGRNNRLNVPAPRNTYTTTCLHTFCDAGCTLSRATFTASYAVGSSPAPTAIFLPWASAPGTPGRYALGSVTMTSGADSGAKRSIVKADSTGVFLAYPLYVVPSAGDTFTAFQGCDKKFTTCNATYSNAVNFRGFPFLPLPEDTAHGQF